MITQYNEIFLQPDSNDSIRAEITHLDAPHTIRFHIIDDDEDSPRFTIYMSELQLILFKNSVISSYEKYLKEKTNG